MLEQRDDVSKRFVESKYIEICWFAKTTMHTVKQCVRCLMCNDVMRDRSKHKTARQRGICVGVRRIEISKQQRPALRAVVRIFRASRVVVNPQRLRELTVFLPGLGW